MKRTGPLKRRTPLKAKTPLRSTGRLAPVSAKRRSLLADYAKAREQVKRRADGRCELRTPVCQGQGTEAHHLAGRVGDRLTDVMLLRWTCRPCHRCAHANVAEAYERGWLVKRLGKGEA